METNKPFIPAEVEIQRDRAGGETLLLSFHHQDGGAAKVVIPTNQVGLLVTSLLAESGVSSPETIRSREMELGSPAVAEGCDVKHLPGGRKRMTLSVRVDDGLRLLPIDLSADEVAGLIADLSR